MNFWIFMLVMNLLIPLTMIIFGYVYDKRPPKKPKSKFAYSGYRTPMSMKNEETWEYAQRFFGKLWFRSGIVLGVISIIPLLFFMAKDKNNVYYDFQKIEGADIKTFEPEGFFIGKDKDTVGFAGMIICYVQLVAMLLPVIPTELALRRRFDRYGNRKDK